MKRKASKINGLPAGQRPEAVRRPLNNDIITCTPSLAHSSQGLRVSRHSSSPRESEDAWHALSGEIKPS